MGIRKRKGTAGAATAFVSRGKAIKKLQLSLKDFRRLCILKGVYPVEPRNKNKAGGPLKTYYLAKDIRFLAHEPIINKFRAMKIFARKLRKAIDKRNKEKEQTIRNNEPTYRLDHIVKERYPTFIDAIRDLDDALSMCFLFATLPKSGLYKSELLQLCRKLSVEFMNYVVESRSLSKCFISIKGFYYQAVIQGQTVTWVVPHGFPQTGDEVDARIMTTFTEFYVTLLGFINFRLYGSVNLVYPPKLSVEKVNARDEELCEGEDPKDDYIESLTTCLKSVVKDVDEDADVDTFDDVDAVGVQQSAESDRNFRNLFSGVKVFLNREVPREPFTFVLRSFGAQVSWDAYVFPGAAFDANDTSITHHIVDRPVVGNKVINRYYVQPQWVFDCANARRLLPVEDYFPGVELPPHLSPFVEQKEGGYTPLSKEEMTRRVEDEGMDTDQVEQQQQQAKQDKKRREMKKQQQQQQQEQEQPAAKRAKTKPADEAIAKKEMSVTKGKVIKVDSALDGKMTTAEEKRLAVMMIPKKDKRLFDSINKKKKIEKRDANRLVKKRDDIIKAKKNALKTASR